MKTAIIYHSHSGITKNVIQKIHDEISADIIEVTPIHPYSSLMVIPKGCYRALRGLHDSVLPEKIDVSAYDLLIIASPVWAGKPTPVINGGIEGLTGCQGKHAFVLLTCKSTESGEQALISMVERLKAKGISISGTVVLDQAGSIDIETIQTVIRDISSL
jgi:flavodoxin